MARGRERLEVLLVVIEACSSFSSSFSKLITVVVKIVRQDGGPTEEHTHISTETYQIRKKDKSYSDTDVNV